MLSLAAFILIYLKNTKRNKQEVAAGEIILAKLNLKW